mmetsp:Transcript_29646/g.84548  ORF Transcript_29646/g.84548 Transcript_29646/m.84548 type:complete len:250 (+) Transcript_29646:73-822(+)
MPAAGGNHTVLLRCDGRAVACGDNSHGQCDLPDLDAGASYVQVAAGSGHTVLLRSDGRAVACGDNRRGQCDLPEQELGAAYCQVAAGSAHTVLLRRDGRAVACGDNQHGQCDLPELEPGASYVQAALGHRHTVLLRSDGRAVACGWNHDGRCDLPELGPGLSYRPSGALRDLVLQLRVERSTSGRTATCRSLLTGDALATWTVSEAPHDAMALAQVRKELGRPGSRVRVVLPDGSLLSERCTWEELFQA